jgi:hypothetical protein
MPRLRVAGTVYVEAEWSHGAPSPNWQWIAGLRRASGYPASPLPRPGWTSRHRAQLERLQAFDFVRGVRHKPRANASPQDGAPGGMTDAAWRRGFAELGAQGCASTCRRRGGTCTKRRRWPATSRECRSSSTTPRCRPTAARKASPRGAPPGASRAVPQHRAEDFRPGRARGSVDGGSQSRHRAGGDRDLRRRRCMFASNFPVDSLCASVRPDLRRLRHHRAGLRFAEPARPVP